MNCAYRHYAIDYDLRAVFLPVCPNDALLFYALGTSLCDLSNSIEVNGLVESGRRCLT